MNFQIERLKLLPQRTKETWHTTNKKVGLQWTCLDFRHTFDSHLAMKGESLYKISALMGNSPEIYRRHYAALIPETLSENVEFFHSSGAFSNAMCC